MPLCAGQDSEGYPQCYNLSRTLARPVDRAVRFVRWVDDQTIIATDNDYTARRFLLTPDTIDMDEVKDETGNYTAIVWSPDGRRVLRYAEEPSANVVGEVVDLATGEVVISIPGPIANAFWLDLAC